MFVFIGMSLIFFQGGVARQLIKRVGERRTALAGVCCTLPGFLIIGNATSVPSVLYGGLLLMTAGSGMTMPSLNSLVSRYTPARPAGFVAGRVPFAWLAEPRHRSDHGRLALLEI